MLAIRLQRMGRKAYPVYRLAVQESRRHPSSGRVVAYVGTYNPHTKDYTLDREKIEKYLSNGAQPTPRVVKLLLAEKIALPAWVKLPDTSKQKSARNPEKLRKNQPKEEVAESSAEEIETPAEPAAEETTKAEESIEATE